MSEIISSDQSPLGRLAATAQSKLGLTDHIRAGLPADLAGQMTSCNLDGEGILTVRASGPEWAARLRFETECILRRCRERHPETRSVKFGVAHPNP